MPARIGGVLVGHVHRRAQALTASERRVAEMAAGGATNREIAQRLFVTAKTVDSHLMRAYRKLGISSRREIAATLYPTPDDALRRPAR